ncbi:hypothetical protein T11_16837, partial [Trichinella zimbabwensis]
LCLVKLRRIVMLASAAQSEVSQTSGAPRKASDRSAENSGCTKLAGTMLCERGRSVPGFVKNFSAVSEALIGLIQKMLTLAHDNRWTTFFNVKLVKADSCVDVTRFSSTYLCVLLIVAAVCHQVAVTYATESTGTQEHMLIQDDQNKAATTINNTSNQYLLKTDVVNNVIKNGDKLLTNLTVEINSQSENNTELFENVTDEK